MGPNKGAPTSLKIVAYIFIIAGVYSLLDILLSLSAGRLPLNLGVLGLFIGWGLLDLSSGWRTCALVCLWLVMLSTPLIGLLFLSYDGSYHAYVFGQMVVPIPLEIGVAITGLLFSTAAWQYYVLTRAHIRKLFKDDQNRDRSRRRRT